MIQEQYVSLETAKLLNYESKRSTRATKAETLAGN